MPTGKILDPMGEKGAPGWIWKDTGVRLTSEKKKHMGVSARKENSSQAPRGEASSLSKTESKKKLGMKGNSEFKRQS